MFNILDMPMPKARKASLERTLGALLASKIEVPSLTCSQALLFALDQNHLSPAEVTTHLLGSPLVHSLTKCRFAGRLVGLGDLTLWSELWKTGSQHIRELITISAFDEVGYDALSLPFMRRPTTNSSFQDLLTFLRSWQGGDPSVTTNQRKSHMLCASSDAPLKAQVLLLGFSGSGKSSAVRELTRMGLNARDAPSQSDLV